MPGGCVKKDVKWFLTLIIDFRGCVKIDCQEVFNINFYTPSLPLDQMKITLYFFN